MSNFAKHNLKEGDDSTTGREGMSAHLARKHLDSQELGVSYFRYAPNFKNTTGHRHREQEEAHVVISGSGRVRVDDEIIDVGPFDVVRVAPAGMRAFAAGPDGLEIIAVGGRRPEGGDGEVVKDWWTD